MNKKLLGSAMAAALVMSLGAGGLAHALPSGPGPGPAPSDPLRPVKDLVDATGVGVDVQVSPEGGHVGIVLPPMPICDIADCNPGGGGPVGRKVIETVRGVVEDAAVDHGTKLPGGGSAHVAGSAGGGSVGIVLPPMPICIPIMDCNPGGGGPVGRLLTLVMERVDDALDLVGARLGDLPRSIAFSTRR